VAVASDEMLAVITPSVYPSTTTVSVAGSTIWKATLDSLTKSGKVSWVTYSLPPVTLSIVYSPSLATLVASITFRVFPT